MEFQLPELGEGVYEAEVSRWLVKPGDTVKPGQPLIEMLTDKATMEVPSPFDGTIDTLRVEPEQQIKVGSVILDYHEEGAEPPSSRHAARAVAAPDEIATPPSPKSSVKAAPAVRQLARKLGVKLEDVKGTGPEGRILADDLTGAIDATSPTTTTKPQAVDTTEVFGKPGTRVKLHGVRRKIADHMVEAKRVIPHYTYVDECDVTDLVRLRESLKEPFANQGVKLTYLAFFVKAVVHALKQVPIVNSSLDDKTGEIVLHDHYHIGLAVASSQGLIVPVIHDADKLPFLEIARQIESLSDKARQGKIKLEDVRAGTFTITSIGNLGGLFATPIIHHPQVGIMGVGKIVKRPIYDDKGLIKPADMIYLSMSFDHRVLDGAIGTAFGNAVIAQLRNPGRLLID